MKKWRVRTWGAPRCLCHVFIISTIIIISTTIIIISNFNMMMISPWSPGRRVRTWGTSRRRTQDFVGNIRLSTKHQCHQMMMMLMMLIYIL